MSPDPALIQFHLSMSSGPAHTQIHLYRMNPRPSNIQFYMYRMSPDPAHVQIHLSIT